MKYIYALIGMIIGKLVGEMLFDSVVIGWIAGCILAAQGYLIPKFLRYKKSSPQQLLSFHGSDAPITRTNSIGEIRAFLSQLHDGGLLLNFNPKDIDVTVDEVQWANLEEEEKSTLCRILTRATVIGGDAPPELKFIGRDGKLIALYSTIDKRIHLNFGT